MNSVLTNCMLRKKIYINTKSFFTLKLLSNSVIFFQLEFDLRDPVQDHWQFSLFSFFPICLPFKTYVKAILNAFNVASYRHLCSIFVIY